MAKTKEVGDLKAKVSLNQVEFNQGITTLSKKMSIVREEFKLASNGLDKVRDSMQIAQLKTKSLTDQIDIQKKIVDQFRQAHQKASEQFGAGSKQATTYELSLKKAESTLQGLDKALIATTASMQKHKVTATETAARMKELGVSYESVGRKLSGLGTALTAAITVPLLAGAGAGFKFNAQMEDFTANFETMLGSADAAKSMIADLTDFAKSTPFEMTGLADSAKILLNFGVNAGDVMKDLQMLGDVSLGNQEKLGRLTMAFGQIQSTGRLMGQDLLQLINAGFNPLQVISEKTGKSMASLKKDMEAGAISSDMVTDAFRTATSEGGTFYKAMDKGSKTFNGQLSTLKDTVNITLGETMKPLFDELSKNVFPKVIKSIEDLGKKFAALSEDQKMNVLKWAAIAAAAGPVLLVVGKLISTIPALITGVKLLGVAFSFLAANPVILGIVAIVAAIGALIYVAGQATREVEEMTAALVENYRQAAEAEKEAIDASYAVRTDALSSSLTAEETASAQRQKDIQAEYDAEIKSLSKREQAMKKSLQERGKALDDAHKTAIDQIRDEYGVFEEKQKTKTEIVQEEADAQKGIVQEVLALSKDIATQEGEAFSKTYDAILEKASDIHDEKLRMYQEEYLQSVMLINQDLAKKIGGYQDEINLLNGKTEEENRIEKEQSDLQKLADLQAKIDAAENDADRVQATKDLNTEISRQNREKELADRQRQIDFLNEQIKTATQKANDEKQNVLRIFQEKTDGQQKILDADTKHTIEKIQEERIAKEKAEDLKYAAAKNGIERQTEEMDGWSERETARLQAELEEKQKSEAEKLQEVRDGVTKQIAEMQRLADAEKAAVDERLRINSLQAKIDAIRFQENQIMNRPWYERTTVTNAIDAINLSKFEQQIATLEDQIAGHGGSSRKIPGFATGVVDWQGGLARVNERGGEIQYLPQGTTVIPNDISMQIARSVGQAVGAAVGGLGGIDYDKLAEAFAKRLEGMGMNVDGRQFGRVVREYV